MAAICASQAAAQTSLSPRKSEATIRQNHEEDNWHSSRNVNSDWPRLSKEDCRRYGAQYGYSECASEPQPRIPARDAAQTAAPLRPSAATTTTQRQRPQQKLLSIKTPLALPPLPQRRPALTIAQPAAPRLTDDEAISRLVMITFAGKAGQDADVADLRRRLTARQAGGIVLTAENVDALEQARALIDDLRSAQPHSLAALEFTGAQCPATAAQLAEPAPLAAMGRSAPQDAHRAYASVAECLSAMGFDMNFGPVMGLVDASTGEGEGFGSDPKHAASFAAAFTLGHKDGRVLTALGSHRLKDKAGQPLEGEGRIAVYREIVKRQLGDAFTVAGAHAQTAVASLRGELQFRGAVIADFTGEDMAAGREALQAKIVAALAAGVDMVVVRASADPALDAAGAASEAIAEALKTGRLDRATFDAAVTRASELRAKAAAQRQPKAMAAAPGPTSQ
ncbi:MAG: glycoside hydrolase family 3 N-terminal domain-containing protein [Hyphomicrobiales bacterium]|nr:glycoside hydrolase family 3 N-terminal domain-containing protein [Hyphomicrobiales bacterium]